MLTISQWDQALFWFINKNLHTDLGNIIFPLLREKLFWLPLYLYLLLHWLLTYQKKGIIIILMFVLNVACTDTISSTIMKPLIARQRPCQDSKMKDSVDLLCGCHGFSFPSSHASNHFGMAILLCLMYHRKLILRFSLIAWALLIGFSQIYVGLHFPFDIAGGIVVGATVANMVYYCFCKYFKIHQWL